MTRLPEADMPSPKRTRYHASGTSEPQPLRGKRTSLLLRCFSSLTHSPFAAQRTAPSTSRSTHDARHEHPPPYRRRLHWTLTIAGCDCGSRSAAREAGRSSPLRIISQASQPDHLHTCIFTPSRLATPAEQSDLNSMSVDERSPKRQRRSFSPPSPAAKLAFVAAEHPHTPPPSVHMSPTWNAQSSSLQNGGGVTFPTPPSTSGYHGHMTGRGPSSDGGVESGTGTPTETGEARKDGDGDVNMGSEVNAEHRRSDHERSSDAKQPAALPLFKLVTKRKFPMHSAFLCSAHG